MTYSKWHSKILKKVGIISESKLYIRVIVFSLFILALTYFYLINQDARNPLNKAVADTSIILISASMLLTSLCYFWDFIDTKIIYRKHLGIIGFVYAAIHILLSSSGLLSLFKLETWLKGTYWPLFTGLIAFVIFSVMALISNKYATTKLGGIGWRNILRTGYIGVAIVWLHVFLLKSVRIVSWYSDGMKTAPPTSLIVLVFMAVVIIMRILLWISLLMKTQTKWLLFQCGRCWIRTSDLCNVNEAL